MLHIWHQKWVKCCASHFRCLWTGVVKVWPHEKWRNIVSCNPSLIVMWYVTIRFHHRCCSSCNSLDLIWWSTHLISIGYSIYRDWNVRDFLQYYHANTKTTLSHRPHPPPFKYLPIRYSSTSSHSPLYNSEFEKVL